MLEDLLIEGRERFAADELEVLLRDVAVALAVNRADGVGVAGGFEHIIERGAGDELERRVLPERLGERLAMSVEQLLD